MRLHRSPYPDPNPNPNSNPDPNPNPTPNPTPNPNQVLLDELGFLKLADLGLSKKVRAWLGVAPWLGVPGVG